MINSAWDKLAEAIEKARIEGLIQVFHWPIYDPVYRVFIEWNGGLPIIGYKNLNHGKEDHDVTAINMRDLLEACE